MNEKENQKRVSNLESNFFWRNNKKYLLGAVLCVILPKVIVALYATPVVDIRDEAAMMAIPNFLIGNDWSNVVKTSGYYGFGFYFLFAPLMASSLPITIIYKIMAIVTSMLSVIVTIISYYIMEHYLDVRNRLQISLVSVLCSYFVVVPVDRLLNDHFLNVIVWCISLNLCKLIENNKCIKRRLHSFSLSLLVAYSLTLHTRALAILIAVVLVILIYLIVFREKLVSNYFWAIIFVEYKLCDWCIEKVQSRIWLADNGSEIVNASVSIPNDVEWTSPEVWQWIIKIFTSILSSFSIFTCGIGIVILFFAIYHIADIAIKRIKNEYGCEYKQKIYFVLFMVWGMCCGATLLVQAAMWLPGVLEGIETSKTVYAYKVFTYLRYFIVYAGPLFLGVFMVWSNEKKIRGIIATLVVTTNILSSFFFLDEIVPYIQNLYAGTSQFFTFAWSCGKNIENYPGSEMYYSSVYWLFATILLFILCYFNNKRTIFFACISCLFIYRYCYFSFNFSYPIAAKQYEEIDKSVEVLNDLELGENEKIYVYDKNMRLQSLYQIYFREQEVIVYDELISETPKMVFSNVNLERMITKGYTEKELDANEYLYVK